MKKLFLAISVALAAMTASAQAADLEIERELGLIVSGVVDSWVGVNIDNGVRCCAFTDDSEAVLATGGEGRLSLPLGDNLSIQTDFKYHYNSEAMENPNTAVQNVRERYSYQGAAHLSWRDPNSGLFGLFGGAGTTEIGGDGCCIKYNAHFVGGEAQFYLNDMTFYAQGGYVSYQSSDGGAADLDDGFFIRGVARWFVTPDSRLQIEGQFTSSDFIESGFGDADTLRVGARYDFTLQSLPIVGAVPVFVGYRGAFRDNCFFGEDLNDHTFMIGTSYSFSGGFLTVDRQGATLDTPNFDACLYGESDDDIIDVGNIN